MKNHLVKLFLIVMMLSFVGGEVFAKGGGGGFSGGGRSFSGGSSFGGGSKSSFGGFSGSSRSSSSGSSLFGGSKSSSSSSSFSGGRRPSSPSASPSTKSGFSGGNRSGETTSKVGTSESKPTVKQSAVEQRMNKQVSAERSKQSLDQYRSQQAKFKQTSSPVSASATTQRTVINRVVVNNYHYDPGVYAYRRSAFYYGWTPPVWGYGFYPRYGMWDTVALWYMLDHMHDQQYAMMYYSHRNDDDMRTWRQQAEQEAANNAKLRQQLADMDARVRAMEGQGVQADPGYVAPDMKEVALAEDTLKNADQLAQAPTPVQPPQPPQEESHWKRYATIVAILAVVCVGAFIFWL